MYFQLCYEYGWLHITCPPPPYYILIAYPTLPREMPLECLLPVSHHRSSPVLYLAWRMPQGSSALGFFFHPYHHSSKLYLYTLLLLHFLGEPYRGDSEWPSREICLSVLRGLGTSTLLSSTSDTQVSWLSFYPERKRKPHKNSPKKTFVSPPFQIKWIFFKKKIILTLRVEGSTVAPNKPNQASTRRMTLSQVWFSCCWVFKDYGPCTYVYIGIYPLTFPYHFYSDLPNPQNGNQSAAIYLLGNYEVALAVLCPYTVARWSVIDLFNGFLYDHTSYEDWSVSADYITGSTIPQAGRLVYRTHVSADPSHNYVLNLQHDN